MTGTLLRTVCPSTGLRTGGRLGEASLPWFDSAPVISVVGAQMFA